MPHILHVINTTEFGGGVQHLMLLTRGLATRGVTSAVVTGIDGERSADLERQGVPVTAIGPMRLAAPGRLAGLLRRRRPDLLHLHGSRAGLAGTIAATSAGVSPVVYTAHAPSFKRRLPPPLPWLAARTEAFLCARATRVICLSAEDREVLARGQPADRCVLVPNGIEVEPFDAGADRRTELGIAADAPVVGMVARLVAGKDPLTFVRAARLVANRVPGARFLLVGDGPMRAAVEQEVAALALGERVIRTGFRRDIPALLATTDVVVFPSLWEALPLGLLEAMAARRAVVASRLPSHAAVVEDGVSGLLVPPGEPAALADRVAGLCADPDRRRALGTAGRAVVERRYGVARMVEDTVAVYRATGLAIHGAAER